MSSQGGYYDLGSFHRPISTNNAESQKWFDRGLIWTFAFNHEEAAHCFEKAIAHDQKCAMAYWGLAYALGPNYNKPWEAFDDEDKQSSVTRTHQAVVQAKSYSDSASLVERALINALQFRYQEGWPAKGISYWNQQYADGMKAVYKDFKDDLDVAALYADALMNLTPWNLWDLKSGEPAHGARTVDAKEALDHGLSLENGHKHPGLLHLYIHLMEMSGRPEAALTVSDNLRCLVPDAGHLNHMPSHIDILCGDYRSAISSNSRAIIADKKYVAQAGPLNFYTLYRAHNYHFRIYAAMFAGQSKVAFQTMSELESTIPEELLRIKSPPMADWLEGFLGVKIHVLVRFGCWQGLINLEIPQDQSLYCATVGMIRYGKAIAFAAINMIGDALKQRQLFHEAVKRVPGSRTLFNNTLIDIFAVAATMLDGEIAYREGRFDAAFEHLVRSIALEDGLPFDEPWGWMQPTRHAYGALLLEQGHFEKAADVYSADLGMDNSLPRALHHPNNVWALHGFHECLVKLGREAEAQILEQQLRLAVAIADVPIRSSCFCRLAT